MHLAQVTPPRRQQLAGGWELVAGQPRLRHKLLELVAQAGQAAQGMGRGPGNVAQLLRAGGAHARRRGAVPPPQVLGGRPRGSPVQQLGGRDVAAVQHDGVVQVVPAGRVQAGSEPHRWPRWEEGARVQRGGSGGSWRRLQPVWLLGNASPAGAAPVHPEPPHLPAAKMAERLGITRSSSATLSQGGRAACQPAWETASCRGGGGGGPGPPPPPPGGGGRGPPPPPQPPAALQPWVRRAAHRTHPPQ
jgi:hypothetical protein